MSVTLARVRTISRARKLTRLPSLPSASFTVQDLPEVIPLTRENIKREAASAVESGRLQAHAADLFKPQTVQADVYTLRYIL